MFFEKITPKLQLLFLFILLFGGSSCATLLGGRHNTLKFENTAGEQRVEVWLDGEKVGEAPGKIRLPARRIQHGSQLELKADGQTVETHVLERRLHGAYFLLDIATTLGIALAIDFGTGHIYRPQPRTITYSFPSK